MKWQLVTHLSQEPGKLKNDRKTLKGLLHMGWQWLCSFMTIFFFPSTGGWANYSHSSTGRALTPLIIKVLTTTLPMILCGLVISIINLSGVSLSLLTGTLAHRLACRGREKEDGGWKRGLPLHHYGHIRPLFGKKTIAAWKMLLYIQLVPPRTWALNLSNILFVASIIMHLEHWSSTLQALCEITWGAL